MVAFGTLSGAFFAFMAALLLLDTQTAFGLGIGGFVVLAGGVAGYVLSCRDWMSGPKILLLDIILLIVPILVVIFVKANFSHGSGSAVQIYARFGGFLAAVVLAAMLVSKWAKLHPSEAAAWEDAQRREHDERE